MTEKKKLELHPEPKRAIQLNRQLIMVVGGIVLTILLLAIIAAFSTDQKPKDSTSSKIKAKTDKASDVNSELKKLPGDYSDVDAIKKYMPFEDNGDKSNQISMLMRQINKLQREQELLRRQLASKKDQPETPRPAYIDPKTRQAMSSGLVFSGVGSDVQNMLSGAKGRAASRLGKKDDDLVPTKEQIELMQEENTNKMTMALLKSKDKPSDIYELHSTQKPPYLKIDKEPKPPKGTRQATIVQAGTLIPATLITGIDTTFRGTIIAQVRSDIYDSVKGRALLIPKGSKLLGEYNSRTITGQRRILLVFNRIVRPDGSSILIGRHGGVDMAGKSGVEGDVNNHWAKIIGASTISTILSIGAGIASDRNDQGNIYYQSSTQRGITGATKGITSVGDQLTSRAMKIKPTITLPPGHQFNMAVKKDIILTPFKRGR